MTIASVSKPAEQRRTLLGIQYLRAIAALMVVIFHLEPQLNRLGYTGFWLKGLSSGVDVFFVISGLIMWVTTSGKKISMLFFLQHRVTRIAPLYWAFTVLMVAIMLVAPQLLQTSRYDGWHILASFLFLPAQHPILHIMEPVVLPGWTLNYEMFFYLIFGFWLFVPERWRLPANIATIGALILVGYAAGLQSRETIAGFYTSSIMIEFLLGMVLGILVTRDITLRSISVPLAWTVLVFGLAFAILLPAAGGGMPRFVSRGIPAFFAIAAILSLELRGHVNENRWLHLLGDASYSLYLSHFVILSCISQIWRRLPFEPSSASYVAFSLVAVVASIVGGVVCYQYVEKPLGKLFKPAQRQKVAPA